MASFHKDEKLKAKVPAANNEPSIQLQGCEGLDTSASLVSRLDDEGSPAGTGEPLS